MRQMQEIKRCAVYTRKSTDERLDAEFNSLSAIAKVITGTHWNGRLFFGIK